MCELMTITAAILFTVLFFAARRAGRPARSLGTTALAFWGAALMWAVDCTHAAMEGESFFDLSWDDTKLGALILLFGLGLFAVLRFRETCSLRRVAS